MSDLVCGTIGHIVETTLSDGKDNAYN